MNRRKLGKTKRKTKPEVPKLALQGEIKKF